MPRSLRDSSFRSFEADSAEDADPRIGLVNLADVMLVFACGLMLALVTYWNLDVSSLSEIIQTQDVTEVTDVETLTDENLGGGGGYTELGTVYRDPMTGKLYMLTEDLDGVEANGTTGGATDGAADAGGTLGADTETGGMPAAGSDTPSSTPATEGSAP